MNIKFFYTIFNSYLKKIILNINNMIMLVYKIYLYLLFFLILNYLYITEKMIEKIIEWINIHDVYALIIISDHGVIENTFWSNVEIFWGEADGFC